MMDSVFIIPGKLGMESRGMIEMREMQVMNMGATCSSWQSRPIQHMVYLYNYSENPGSSILGTEIMDKLYTAGPDHCGDERQRSDFCLVHVFFSALGFYTVCPGTDQLFIFWGTLFSSQPNCIWKMENRHH